MMPALELGRVFRDSVALPRMGEPLNVKALPGFGGVYAFSGSGESLIQVVCSENIRRSAIARLERETTTSRGRAELRSVAERLWWTRTTSVFDTTWTYLTIARQLWPGRYQDNLPFAPAWFASIAPGDRFPRWRVGKYAFAKDSCDVGPFESRKQCGEFVKGLEDLFDLCREYEILRQTPHGEACAYFEMGKCPAPCNGTVSMDVYRTMLDASIRFAGGDHDERLAELTALMASAAKERAFDRAARIKATISGARQIIKRFAPIAPTPQLFRYLVVQRCSGRARLQPYFVAGGSIERGATVAIRKVSDAVTLWIERARKPCDTPADEPVRASEHIWLMTHFLIRGSRAPGVFLRVDDLPTPDKLTHLLTERFVRSAEPSHSVEESGFSVDDTP